MMYFITFDGYDDTTQQDRDQTAYTQAMGNSQQDCQHIHKRTKSHSHAVDSIHQGPTLALTDSSPTQNKPFLV